MNRIFNHAPRRRRSGPRMRHDAWSDGAMLQALHLRDVERLSMAEIGRRLGVTKNAVSGVLHRIARDEVPGGAGNGTLAPEWWRAGLGRRSAGTAS